jgi:phosphoglucosamine mutase
MNRQLFGTDGMRAKAGEYPLDEKTVTQVGKAVGSQFAGKGKTVIVGNDPRESSAAIVAALSQGLASVGCKVVLVGVLPTPGVAFLSRDENVSAGVMVTASHNPYTDNGIKVFKSGGHKLTDADEVELNQAIESGEFEQVEGSIEEESSLASQYADFLSNSADGLELGGLKLAVDCANGAASDIAAKLFERLGAEVTAIFNSPDGKNINAGCGATDIKALQKQVVDNQLDVGVALDGDADRLIMVDSQGREFTGDHILYLLAVSYELPAVVATVMSNYGLETSLAAEGIKLHRTQVGDRYVLDELRQQNLKLGGEQSGHIVIHDLQPTGDGLLAAVQVLAAVKKTGKSLDRWYDEVELLPQAVVNLKIDNKDQLNDPSVQELIKRQNDAIDGGRLLVRASGTEPLIRVMVEGPDARDAAESIAEEIKDALAKL